MADVKQNKHGQWCTEDGVPHPSREAAERSANSDYAY